MSRYRASALLAVVAAFALLLTSVPLPSLGARPSITAGLATSPSLPPIDPVVGAQWDAADGPVARFEVTRGWVWGPSSTAVSVDDVPGTDGALRRQVYFDKGRLDVVDPAADPAQPWFAVGAQLVTELLSGAIQTADGRWIERGPANIPVVGDVGQPNPVTYATLGTLSRLPTDESPVLADDATGSTVTAVLHADGTVTADGLPSSTISIGRFDEQTRHNIAQPFVEWEASQPYSALYVLGHPLSEPYWVQTEVAGVAQHVLLQAFERRVLSYTPANPEGWRTESGNAGQHYRIWRDLGAISDSQVAALAVSVPYGDEIVQAAAEAGVDPWLVAAISTTASDGNPLAASDDGHVGLLGIRWSDVPRDPQANARIGAAELARISATTDDTALILARYYAGDDADPSATGVAAFVGAATAALSDLHARLSIPAAADTAAESGEPVNAPLVQIPARFASSWWTQSLSWYASWSGTRPGAAADPADRWCVAPGYVPGDRLQLTANGKTTDCTVGATPGAVGLPALTDGSIGISATTAASLALNGEAEGAVIELGAQPALQAQPEPAGRFVGEGAAAYYSASYDRAWWDRTIGLHASWGGAVSGWAVDPNGYYCVHPDFRPGQRLRLVANGVTIECTIGDSVQAAHQAQWRAKWAVELSWDTFAALGLDKKNVVQVFAIE